MIFIWITLLLVLSCLSPVPSYKLTTVEISTIPAEEQDTPDSSTAQLDFRTSATENSISRAKSLPSPRDLHEEITAVDSTHTSADSESRETVTNVVTMMLKTPINEVSTWKSMILIGDTEVSTKEILTTTTTITTENQRGIKLTDLVEDTTILASRSSELTTKIQRATQHSDLVENETTLANGSSGPTTTKQKITKHSDLVEDETTLVNESSGSTTENQRITKHSDLVEHETTLAKGSSESTRSPKITVQELITSSTFNLPQTQEGDANTTSETAMTHRTASPPEKTPTHSIMGQCLMAIFILAFIATLFIICTIVLIAKLTIRKDYRRQNQHSTEMMCISSLLPDNETAAERSKLKPKRMKNFRSNVDDSDEDNTTLNSFLPDH